MTAIRGYVAPTTESDALGVHSLDQFVLTRTRCVGGAGFLRPVRPRRAARRQRARDQDIRSRASLGVGGRRRQGEGAAPSFIWLLCGRSSAPEGAHRRAGRQTHRSAARVREQRLLVPQPRRRADRSKGRAESFTRQEIRKPMDFCARRRRGRKRPGKSAAGASASAISCADFHARRRRIRSNSTNARLACVCQTAHPISLLSCTGSTAATIISWRW